MLVWPLPLVFCFRYFLSNAVLISTEEIESNLASILPAQVLQALLFVRRWIVGEMQRENDVRAFGGQSGAP